VNPVRSALLPLVLALLIGIVVVLAVSGAADQGGIWLLARSADGGAAQVVRPGPARQAVEPADAPAVPLLLVAQNDSRRTLRATRLELLLPARFRLLPRAGVTAAPVARLSGRPVTRYRIAIGALSLPSGGRRDVTDTLWVERTTPALGCVVGADSVPRFEATPALPADAVTTLRIFYSLGGGSLRRPAEGLLTLDIDPRVALPAAEPEPPRFPVLSSPDRAVWPALDSLRRVGMALTQCGPVEDPIAMSTTEWTAGGGGRVFGLSIGAHARKYVYDLNGDSIADLEIWDSDGSGRFRSSSRARFRVPPYLYAAVPPTAVPVDSTRSGGRAAQPKGPGS
jgi:hypothetical protein